MSEQRQVRNLDRRSPVRHAAATRQSSGGSCDRIASAREVAVYLREDCRGLRDSLQLEMVVAQYHLRMRDVLTPEGVPAGEAVSAAVIAELERQGDPLSHAILRGLAYLGRSEPAKRSADAAGRLANRGIGLPPELADVTEARPLGAWRDTRGAWDDEYALFVDFRHPLGARHSLALFVEPRHGGVIKHIGLMKPMNDLDLDDPFHPNALEPVAIATAAELMREVLDRSFPSCLADSDDYRVLIAGARARSMEDERAAAGR